MLQVAILVFPEAEVLDFAGPFETLNMANRMRSQNLFNVFLIAEKMEITSARNGFKVLPDFSIDDAPAIDVLIVPGGEGRIKEMKNQRLLQWIRKINDDLRFLLSVCTGAFVLAEAGLLNDLNATTHWAAYDEFEAAYPQIRLNRNVRFVENDHIWTSGGVSAGIDMTLGFIAKLYGEDLAEKTAKRMEYKYEA